MHETPVARNESSNFELPSHHKMGRHLFIVPEGAIFKHKLFPNGKVALMDDYFQSNEISDDGTHVIGSFLYSHMVNVVVPVNCLQIPQTSQIEELKKKSFLSKSQTLEKDGLVKTDEEAVKKARESYLGKEVLISSGNSETRRAIIVEVFNGGFAKALFSEDGQHYEQKVDIQDIREVV